MADKTIPELTSISLIEADTLIPVDTGVQTFKVRADDFKKSLNAIVQTENVGSVRPITAADKNTVFFVEDLGYSIPPSANFELPGSDDFGIGSITIKDLTGRLSHKFSDVVVTPVLGDFLEGRLGAQYQLKADFGSWVFYCDGTKWFIL